LPQDLPRVRLRLLVREELALQLVDFLITDGLQDADRP
jgi:hypothetical protein